MKTLKFKEYRDLNERQFYTRNDWDEFENFQYTKEGLQLHLKIMVGFNPDEPDNITWEEIEIFPDHINIIAPGKTIDTVLLFKNLKTSLPIKIKKIVAEFVVLDFENLEDLNNFPEVIDASSVRIRLPKINKIDKFPELINTKKFEIRHTPIFSLDGLPLKIKNIRIAGMPALVSYAGLDGQYIDDLELVWNGNNINRDNGLLHRWPFILSHNVLNADKIKNLKDKDKQIENFDVSKKGCWEALLTWLKSATTDEIQFHYTYLEKVFALDALNILDYGMELLDFPIEKIKKDSTILNIRKTKNEAEDDIGFSF